MLHLSTSILRLPLCLSLATKKIMKRTSTCITLPAFKNRNHQNTRRLPIENARPSKQHLSRAKTQRENELVHVRPTLQLASPGCCEKVSAKLLHLHRQNQRICLCPKRSLSQKKIPGKDPEKSRTETNSANASLPCQKSSQKNLRRKARQQNQNQQSRKKTEPPCHRKAPPEQHLPRCRNPRTPLLRRTNPHHRTSPQHHVDHHQAHQNQSDPQALFQPRAQRKIRRLRLSARVPPTNTQHMSAYMRTRLGRKTKQTLPSIKRYPVRKRSLRVRGRNPSRPNQTLRSGRTLLLGRTLLRRRRALEQNLGVQKHVGLGLCNDADRFRRELKELRRSIVRENAPARRGEPALRFG